MPARIPPAIGFFLHEISPIPLNYIEKASTDLIARLRVSFHPKSKDRQE